MERVLTFGILSTVHALAHLVLTTAPGDGCSYHPLLQMWTLRHRWLIRCARLLESCFHSPWSHLPTNQCTEASTNALGSNKIPLKYFIIQTASIQQVFPLSQIHLNHQPFHARCVMRKQGLQSPKTQGEVCPPFVKSQ